MNATRSPTSRQAVEKHSSIQQQARPTAPAWPNLAQASDNTPEKHRCGSAGTGHAIKSSISSGALDSARRWGGRRNSAARISSSLSLKQAAEIIEAAQFAAAIGLPFNRHVTIHWDQAGVPDSAAAKATGRFLKLAGDWIAKRNRRFAKVGSNSSCFAWAWVRENGDDKGSHVHILLHLPANKIEGKNWGSLGNMPRRWLRLITGKPYRAGTIKTERIGGTAGAAQSAPAAYQENLAAVVGYILKGACPAAALALGLNRLEPSGTIIGKRAATSQNVAHSARARSNIIVKNTPLVGGR